MELGCTKKLLEYLGVKPEKGFAEVDIDCGKAAIFAIQQ